MKMRRERFIAEQTQRQLRIEERSSCRGHKNLATICNQFRILGVIYPIPHLCRNCQLVKRSRTYKYRKMAVSKTKKSPLRNEPSPAITKITAQQAAKNAAQYFNELIPNMPQLQLEEVELVKGKDGKDEWLLTLSFASPYASGLNLLARANAKDQKEYKEFRVNAYSGEVISMKIRNV